MTTNTHGPPLASAGRLIGTSALACLAVAAHAEEEQAITLDETVVVGSRAPAKISDLPGTVWVVEPEQFMEQVRGGASLKEALGKLIPSLDVAPQGRTNYGQNMRGRSVLVMIDGVSLNSSRGISRQFDSIDPFNIARVEVLSGATALYGGGATGGIINIITRRGDSGGPDFATQTGATSGFNDGDDYQARGAQSVSGGSERVRGRLGLAYQRNGGFYDGSGEQIIPDISQTDLQYNRSIDLTGSLDIDLGPDQSLAFTGQLYDSGYDGDRGLYLGEDLAAVTGSDPGSFDIRGGFESDREPATERHMLNATYHHADLLGQELYLQAFTRGEEAAFHPFPYLYSDLDQDGNADPYYSASEQNTDVHGAKALVVTDLSPVRLQWGVDADRETFDANQMLFDYQRVLDSGGLKLDETATVGRYPNYQVDTMSAFLQGEWQVSERWRLSAGVRRQHSDVEIDDFVGAEQQVAVANGLADSAAAIPGGSNDYETTLVNVGAVFDVSMSDQLWTNFSQGFEIPDPAKYYGQGQYTLDDGRYVLDDSVNVDDSPLKGIKTSQVEIGWRHFGERTTAQVAAYYAWSEEALDYDSQSLAVKVLDDETRDYGIEGKLSYRLTRAWRVGGSGHLVRSERKVDGEWQKRAATSASLSKATAFAGWQRGGTRVRLQYTRTFDLEDDAGNEIKGFQTVDLLGSHQLPVGELSFGIRNLLDEEYTTVWGQRAQIFYAPYYGPEEMFDFKGRGRTYSLTYTVHY